MPTLFLTTPNWQPLLDTIKKDIDRAKVISFDIFDTLLLRPYLYPVDMFLHIEKVKKQPFFYRARIAAEQAARQKQYQCEDITLDDIYAELPAHFLPLQQVELDFEMQLIRQNPEMQQVWNYAKGQGKIIIIASDMYLPGKFISRLLQKNGFADYDALYISGDSGKSKHCGTLYQHIISDMIVTPQDILHIGDNKHADYHQAKKHGIQAILYKQVISQFSQNNKRVQKFIKSSKNNIAESILISMLAFRWHKNQLSADPCCYWNDIGYNYAGPVAYGYSRWIENEALKDKLDHIIFVARDGYILQKVFAIFNNNIRTSYVYAPRLFNDIFCLDYQATDSIQASAIINYYCEKDFNLKKLVNQIDFKTPPDYHKFIQDNKATFIQLAQSQLAVYKNYLLHLSGGGEQKIGLVDTTTWHFSSQHLIEHALSLPVNGFYWAIRNKRNKLYNCKQFATTNKNGISIGDAIDTAWTENWDFIEFLLNAPEFPVKSILASGEPVYDKSPPDCEQFRKSIYPEIVSGALDFSHDLKNTFINNEIYLDCETICRWINYFCNNPSNTDIKSMSNISYAAASNHDSYIPLFSTSIPFKNIISAPYRSLEIVKRLRWHSPLQILVLCLIHPVKLKIRGMKQISLILLPRLKKQYLFCKLQFAEKLFYSVIIGNPTTGK